MTHNFANWISKHLNSRTTVQHIVKYDDTILYIDFFSKKRITLFIDKISKTYLLFENELLFKDSFVSL